ncbi:MAG TPA: hypothetical protein VFU21_02590 [Kofleriaceae bacterium]|nr:hypothetical protein [Kofleriaceae bacterium]
MRRAVLLAALAAVLADLGCERPRAFVICHNANCYGPTDPFLDDTVQALRRSLDLRWNGEPLVDGVELDSLWDPAGMRCAFAHDPSKADTSFGGVEAAEEVAQHLRDTAPEVGDRRFYVKLEMKPVSGPDGDPLTAQQARAHTDCALDMYEVLAAAAADTGRRLTVFFESTDPALVALVTERPRYPGKNEGENIETGIVVPIDADPPDGLEVDAVTIVWNEVSASRADEFRELRSRDIDLIVWMYDADITVFEAIDLAEPRFVTTSEAPLVREWLGPAPRDE